MEIADRQSARNDVPQAELYTVYIAALLQVLFLVYARPGHTKVEELPGQRPSMPHISELAGILHKGK